MALYDAEHGFYSSGRARIGRGGDFFTNVSVGPLFGQMLARQFEQMWELLGKPHEFTLVEQGANNGDFARDVLQAAKGEFREALRCTLVEPAPILRARQQENLRDFSANVTWCESLEALAPFSGVHFSNELFDALPVHLVRFVDGEWRECFVDGDLQLIDGAPSSEALRARIEKLALPGIENYETEVNLDALNLMDEIAKKLSRGYTLAIDYGFPRDVFYAPERARGTLTAHARHRRSFNPLELVGESDLTAHVDFTSLAERGVATGCALAGFTDQHHFLASLAQYFFASSAPDAKQARALQTLMHPQFLGTVFKVLALQKAVASPQTLTGFEFARDPHAALGLAGAAD